MCSVPHSPLTRDGSYVRKAFDCPQLIAFTLVYKENLIIECTWRHGPEYLEHVPDQPRQEEEGGLPGDPDDQEDGGETAKDGGNDRAQQNDHDNVKMVFWFIRRNIIIQFIQTVDL